MNESQLKKICTVREQMYKEIDVVLQKTEQQLAGILKDENPNTTE